MSQGRSGQAEAGAGAGLTLSDVMTYYKPTSDYKSTLGILTGGVGIDSYGMKLNTTLLRFYLQNTNL